MHLSLGGTPGGEEGLQWRLSASCMSTVSCGGGRRPTHSGNRHVRVAWRRQPRLHYIVRTVAPTVMCRAENSPPLLAPLVTNGRHSLQGKGREAQEKDTGLDGHLFSTLLAHELRALQNAVCAADSYAVGALSGPASLAPLHFYRAQPGPGKNKIPRRPSHEALATESHKPQRGLPHPCATTDRAIWPAGYAQNRCQQTGARHVLCCNPYSVQRRR